MLLIDLQRGVLRRVKAWRRQAIWLCGRLLGGRLQTCAGRPLCGPEVIGGSELPNYATGVSVEAMIIDEFMEVELRIEIYGMLMTMDDITRWLGRQQEGPWTG